MAHSRKAPLFALVSIATCVATHLAAQEVPLRNWPAPATYTAPHPSGMKSLLTDAGNPAVFVPITPCRIADTRGLGFTGQAGPPSLSAGVGRNFKIGSLVPGVPVQCGIPFGAQAVSFNFAVTDISANGNLVVYPQGGSAPTVSSLNYQVGFAALSNAAVIPLGTSEGITVLVNGSGTVDVIIDVNGYYGPNLNNSNRTLTLNSGGNTTSFHTTGSGWAVEAMCEVANLNCKAFTTGGMAGNYAASFSAGRGSFFVAFDDTYPGAEGYFSGTTGANAGVAGVTLSTGNCASGVKGVGHAEPPCSSAFVGYAGVLGTVDLGYGVLGYSPGRGVQGTRIASASDGTPVTSGVLGFNGTSGVHSFGDITAAGVKSFVEPHPSDSTRQINFIAAEANEPMTIFRGRARFRNGAASLRVPEEFQLVTDPDSLSIQVMPIGELASFAVTRIGLDGIALKSNRDVEFFYEVHGRRAGFEDRRPIEENTLFVPDGPDDRMPGYPPRIQKRLVELGIYNPDGTVNMKTAEANGWAEQWRRSAAAAKALADAQRAIRMANHPEVRE